MGFFDFLKPKEITDKLDGLPKTLYGPSKTYFENGNIRVERNYSEGKLNGPFKNYYEDGSIRGEGNYKEGEFHGIIKLNVTDFSKKLRKFEINYLNGKKDGKCLEFFSDGTLRCECFFKNNRPADFQNWKGYEKDGTFKHPPEVDFSDFLWFEATHAAGVKNEVDLKRKLKYR